MKRSDTLECRVYQEYPDRVIAQVNEIFVDGQGWIEVNTPWIKVAAQSVDCGVWKPLGCVFEGVNLRLEWADGTKCYNAPDYMFCGL